MKRIKGFVKILAVAMILFGFSFLTNAKITYAASYKEVDLRANKTGISAGKYYLKVQNGTVYYSKAKGSGYKIAVKPRGSYKAAVNGKAIVFIDNLGKSSLIKQFDLQTGKVKVLKKVNAPGRTPYFALHISEVYRNKLYITYSVVSVHYDLYVFDLKSGRFIKIKDRFGIDVRKGSYFIGGTVSEIGSNGRAIYKFSGNGIKRVRKLCNNGNGYSVYGKYFYYTEKSTKTAKETIYRCRTNGKGKSKKLASVKGHVTDITPKGYTMYTPNYSKKIFVRF